ncbi:MAG: replicative DNA helicase [Nocardioidaceae bacterium]|nr:MAG: replicative DNA helicase [Nocardioidaceae bacterium]
MWRSTSLTTPRLRGHRRLRLRRPDAPQDMDAEMCVLGAMLLAKDAIADVLEVLRGGDFYRPVHETIFDVVSDLYARNEPVDPVTTAAELSKRGELMRIGGAPYLHTLSASVPIASNASYYAGIVKEKAILRRLVEAGTRITQMGYAGEGEVDDVVDQAQQEVYNVSERRSAEDYAPLSDIIEATLDEIEAIQNRESGLSGVPTGFLDLDDLTNGLHGGQMVIVAARPAVGKALALDTPLPTPRGWTTMGEVAVGDQLIAADGRPTIVVATTDVMVNRPCYRITFSDGSSIVADAEHQWLTETRAARKSAWAAKRQYNRARNQCIHPSVVTTHHIAETLRVDGDARVNHAVLTCAPLSLPEVDLPLPPYVLGAWLGDGHSSGGRITSETAEIPMYIEAEGIRCEPRGDMLYSLKIDRTTPGPRKCEVCDREFQPRHDRVFSGEAQRCMRCHQEGTVVGMLRGLGVLGDKHIPARYLRASESQRRALLAGLLDTDGTVTKQGGSVQLSVTNRRLAHDAYELIVGLGYRCSMTTKRVRGRTEATSIAYTLTFSTVDDVFRLERKAILHKETAPQSTVRIGRRYITRVEPVRSVPVRCVQVDNADHLYLAGRSMIPTHNSTLALDLCRAASIHNNLTSVIFSLEMSRTEITMRLLSAEARVALAHIRNGSMSEQDWERLAPKMAEVSSAPLFIDDSPNMTMMEIRAKARRLKQRHDLRLIVIDYLQLMTSGKRVESRQVEVSEFSRQIKLLAKELDVPVVALSQLNRGSEQRSDKRPMLSDLRESGCVTADTRLMRADTNAEITIGELMQSGVCDIPVWALDDRLKLVPRTLTHAFPSGTKDVYEVTLASGRTVTATGNHPFLTYDGWLPLAELAEGTGVGAVRHVPPPLEITPRDNDEVALLARSKPEFVPDWVFALPKEQVSLFLRNLWATDGSVTLSKHGGGRVYYASTSRRLIDDVAKLLLRFNVFTRIRRVRKAGYRDGWTLDVTGAENQLRFLEDIGVHGYRGVNAIALAERLREIRPNTNLDTIPTMVWDRVRSVLDVSELTQRQFAEALGTKASVSTMARVAPSRQRMRRIAEVLGDVDLEVMATNDVFWDSIASIKHLGVQEVYDATVMGVHNFVANGVCLHNSIEQDADMVILLHRDDVYEKESPRLGEADLIVAKHRNGPTRDVVVAFQGHYSRFVDMTQG